MFRKVNKKILIIFSVILLIVTGIGIYYVTKENNDSIETLSKYGSRGSEVTQIQTKLKRWGYYSRKC
ncbi:spore cortex-lytic enzyme [Clostridium sp. CAG:440]|jgi:uncharacterized protein YxeA|nr:spore cortex-lytic enzyme [Clostridium sp. CAG:440]